MSDLKRHNPLSLGLSPKPPDFTNDTGYKWWGIDIGDLQDGVAALVEAPDGSREYVIMDERGVFYATHSLEYLAGKFDQLRLIREHGEEPKEK